MVRPIAAALPLIVAASGCSLLDQRELSGGLTECASAPSACAPTGYRFSRAPDGSGDLQYDDEQRNRRRARPGSSSTKSDSTDAAAPGRVCCYIRDVSTPADEVRAACAAEIATELDAVDAAATPDPGPTATRAYLVVRAGEASKLVELRNAVEHAFVLRDRGFVFAGATTARRRPVTIRTPRRELPALVAAGTSRAQAARRTVRPTAMSVTRRCG